MSWQKILGPFLSQGAAEEAKQRKIQAQHFWGIWLKNLQQISDCKKELEALHATTGTLASKRVQTQARLELLEQHQKQLSERFPSIRFEVV